MSTTYTYRNNALVLTETAGQVTRQYTYDVMGRKRSETNGLDETTGYTYDVMGRITQITYPDETTVCYSYIKRDENDNIVNRVVKTDERNVATTYEYDLLGRLTSVSVANTPVAGFEYDRLSRLVGGSDGNGNRVAYTYDRKDRRILTQCFDAQDNELYRETVAYNDAYSDTCRQAVLTEGANSSYPIVSKTYADLSGNVVKETRGQGAEEAETTYTYDYLGNRLTVLKPNAQAAGKAYTFRYTIAYAAYQKDLYTTDVYNKQGYDWYDGAGRPKESCNRNGHYSVFGYDDRNRLISQYTTCFGDMDIGYEMSAHLMTYDAADNLIQEQQQNNIYGGDTSYRTLQYTADSRGRRTEVRGNYSGKACYTYDGAGNITCVQNGVGGSDGAASYYYQYDPRGQVIELKDPLNQTETCTYDNNGNLVAKHCRKPGHAETCTYDGLNRLLSRHGELENTSTEEIIDEQTEAAIYYAGSKLLSSMQNAQQSKSFTYNSRALPLTVTEVTGGVTTVKAYTYDLEDHVTSLQITRGGSCILHLSYTYDLLGRLLSVTDTLHHALELARYEYDGEGNVTKKTQNDNALVTTYSYNGLERPVLVVHKNAGGSTLSQYSYDYYADGNVRTATRSGDQGILYTYDGKGRLVSEAVTDGSGSKRYIYDCRDNLEEKNTTDYRIYCFNNRNGSLQEYDFINTGEDNLDHYEFYDYDADGNPTRAWYYQYNKSKEEYDLHHTTTLTYDTLGHLTAIDTAYTQTGETSRTEYTYGADGLRLSKTVDGVRTDYIWDGGKLVAEISGGQIQTHFYGMGLIASRTNNTNDYYLIDGHGDVTQVISENGALVYTAYYDAFGNITSATGSYTPHFRYCGEYYDTETGWYYLRNRYYSPITGRFLTEDPARDGLNWYTYCGNNPVAFVDPWGLDGFLSGDPQYWETTFNEMQMLTDDKLDYDRETGKVVILKFGDGNFVTGTQLLRELLTTTDFTVYIERNSRFENGELRPTGEISHKDRGEKTISAKYNINDEDLNNPNLFILLKDVNGNTYLQSYASTPSYLFLGHELIHAQHRMNGTYNSTVDGIHYYTYNGVTQSEQLYNRTNEEFETVGIFYYTKDFVNPNSKSINPHCQLSVYQPITENSLRQEHSLDARIVYSAFDRNGNIIK